MAIPNQNMFQSYISFLEYIVSAYVSIMFGTKNHLTSRRRMAIWKRRLRSNCLLQILLILGFWQIGEAIARVFGLPIPGAIVGLFLVLALLANNLFSPHTFRRGANWFLAQLLLFLLPTVLCLLDHPEFFGMVGLKIFAAILLGTLMVMVVTALVVDLCYRRLIARNSYAKI